MYQLGRFSMDAFFCQTGVKLSEKRVSLMIYMLFFGFMRGLKRVITRKKGENCEAVLTLWCRNSGWH